MRSTRDEPAAADDRAETIRLAQARLPIASPRTLGLRARALWIAAAYAVVSLLWIYFSDQLLASIVADEADFPYWSSFKGFGFVAASTVLLAIVLRHGFLAAQGNYRALMLAERRARRAPGIAGADHLGLHRRRAR